MIFCCRKSSVFAHLPITPCTKTNILSILWNYWLLLSRNNKNKSIFNLLSHLCSLLISTVCDTHTNVSKMSTLIPAGKAWWVVQATHSAARVCTLWSGALRHMHVSPDCAGKRRQIIGAKGLLQRFRDRQTHTTDNACARASTWCQLLWLHCHFLHLSITGRGHLSHTHVANIVYGKTLSNYFGLSLLDNVNILYTISYPPLFELNSLYHYSMWLN